MIAKGISEAENVLAQMVLQELLALQNFVQGYCIGKNLELWVRMTMCAALYTARTDFRQLLPSEHEACRFLLVPQPATCSIDKCGRNVKRSGEIVLHEYWKGSSKKIGETVIER